MCVSWVSSKALSDAITRIHSGHNCNPPPILTPLQHYIIFLYFRRRQHRVIRARYITGQMENLNATPDSLLGLCSLPCLPQKSCLDEGWLPLCVYRNMNAKYLTCHFREVQHRSYILLLKTARRCYSNGNEAALLNHISVTCPSRKEWVPTDGELK